MITDSEFYYWETEEAHADNGETMNDFLDNILSDEYRILLHDGTYAEIQECNGGHMWAVHASGDGDFNNHKVQFVPLVF